MKRWVAGSLLLVQLAASFIFTNFAARVDYWWSRGVMSTQRSDFDVMVNGPLVETDLKELLVESDILSGQLVMEIIPAQIISDSRRGQFANIRVNLMQESEELSWLGYSVPGYGADYLLIDWETARLLGAKRGRLLTILFEVQGQSYSIQKRVAGIFTPNTIPGNIILQDNQLLDTFRNHGVMYSTLYLRTSKPENTVSILRSKFRNHFTVTKDQMVGAHRKAILGQLTSKSGLFLLGSILAYLGGTICLAILLHRRAANAFALSGASLVGALSAIMISNRLLGLFMYHGMAIALGLGLFSAICSHLFRGRTRKDIPVR